MTRGFAMSLWKTLYRKFCSCSPCEPLVSFNLYNTLNWLVVFGVATDIAILAALPGCAMPVTICVVVLLYLAHQFYMPISRRLKELEKQCKALLLTHVADISSGIESIRTFQWQADIMNEGLRLLDNAQPSFYYSLDAERWLQFVLDSFSNTLTVFIIALGICTKAINPDKAGLALFILTTFADRTTVLVQKWAELDTMKQSVSRIYSFMHRAQTEPLELYRLARTERLGNTAIELRNVTAELM